MYPINNCQWADTCPEGGYGAGGTPEEMCEVSVYFIGALASIFVTGGASIPVGLGIGALGFGCNEF
ncbi:hypothetical protein [Geodermatophilus sp. DF01-2]|uniref:hypothetical protein n=1 Tax=Geodermatophilus sp. DF01-2 TaxID=2559610 RepID=UPI001FD836A4|nr:hypothetical protein [Geodermatophilus sp. DF01_2]